MIKILKLQMVLIYDISEIDVRDAFCYDKKANEYKQEKEKKPQIVFIIFYLMIKQKNI